MYVAMAFHGYVTFGCAPLFVDVDPANIARIARRKKSV